MRKLTVFVQGDHKTIELDETIVVIRDNVPACEVSNRRLEL